MLDRLVSQVSNPVRWDLCMQTFADLGVTGLIEIPPAGTLASLAKRACPASRCSPLKTPDDLEQARRMIREHGAEPHRPPARRPGTLTPHPQGSLSP